MFFSDRVTLRTVTYTTDVNGRSVQTNTDTVVWANVSSATRSEFYAANANGIEASIMFSIHLEDWGGQSHVVYNGKTYRVVRTYLRGLGTVELTCSDMAV